MVIPCLCLSRFSSCTVHHKTAVIPVDIPTHWEPRTNKHPTGVFVAPPAAWHVLFESCTVRLRRGLVDDATKKPLTKVRGSCFGGELGTRTPDPLRVMQVL